MSRRSKGEGTIRKRSDGRWEGRFVNCIGETKYLYGQSKSDVKRKLQEITYVNDTDTFKEIRGDIELDIWFEHYVEVKKRMIKARSLNQTIIAYKAHISPVLGKLIMCQISTNDIVNLMNVLEKKNISESHISNILTHAHTMFNFAVQEGVIAKSPFLYIKHHQRVKKTRRNITSEELSHILEVAKSLDYSMYLMLITMLCTGIRAGELCGIRWNDFDKNFVSLRIDEAIPDHKFENTTKTCNSDRVIPLMKVLQDEYKELYTYKQPKEDDFVFINRIGTPFRTENVDHKFRYIRKCVMDIYPEDNISDITPHCLRHTFTTNGITAGVPIKNMQLLLGHADTRTLLSTYMHVSYEDKKTSIDIIENNSITTLLENKKSSSETKLNEKWGMVKRYKGIENYNKELKCRLT